jgi:hypothetical protein
VSLTLPDICGKIQYPNKSSKIRYIEWFNKYISKKYIVQIIDEKHTFLTAEDCYALRCSFLHEGTDDISEQQCRKVLEYFIFSTNTNHNNFFNVNGVSFLQLKVDIFCKDICDGVQNWILDLKDDVIINGRLSEMIKIHDESYFAIGGIGFGKRID